MALNELDLMELKEVEELEEKKEFKVNDLSGANWVLRKLKALAKEEQEVKDLEREELLRIKAWKDSRLKEIEGSKDFFIMKLREYYEMEKALNEKFKLSTPNGTFYTKTNMDKIEINTVFEEKIIENFEKNGDLDLINVKKTIDIKALRERIIVKDGVVYDKDTGEAINGIKMVPQGDSPVLRLR